MTVPGFQLDCLLDPRLAPHAASPRPTWLWSADARRILWSNPAGAAIFGADTPAAAAALRFDAAHPAAAQIARLAATLTDNGAPRLERLRGFGARAGGMLTCACSRIALHDGSKAVLVVAMERAGPDFSLAERARRLLADNDSPVAAFGADGTLLHAAPAIALGDVHDLAAIGADALAAEAIHSGAASGPTRIGVLSLARIGEGASTILLATLDPAQPQAAAAETAPAAPSEPAPPAGAEHPEPPPAAEAACARAHPLRFVWSIDDAGRFTFESDSFATLIGPATTQALQAPWSEIAARFRLDPDGAIARAVAARETFSGLIVPWPVDGSSETLPVELSGLPVFDRERAFRGYRGFGICRDVARLEALATARALLPPEPPKEPPKPAAAAAENVVPFRAAPGADAPPDVFAPEIEPPPTLSAVEKLAFRELARRLSDGLKHPPKPAAPPEAPPPAPPLPPPAAAPEPQPPRNGRPRSETPILDRLPFGILVYRLNDLLYANKAFLDWTGYASLHDLVQAGGLDTLFIDASDGASAQNGTPLTISTQAGDRVPVEGRLFSTTWNDESALVLMLNVAAAPSAAAAAPDPRLKEAELALRRAEAEAREFKTILDTATDGVVVIDRDGRILSANRSAEALFGHEFGHEFSHEFGHQPGGPALLGDLFAPESRRAALDYLDHIAQAGPAALINEGREVIGRVHGGGLIPLFMTLGRLGDAGDKFCAVLRDITAWKKNEEELLTAKRQAEKTSAAKSEFLAKVSHDIRAPLSTIIGFSEMMIDERFGPIGNERYRDYLKDIRAAGEHLIALLNDLVDLSKIETGKLDLTFASLGLNDLVQQCVAALQPQANRARVIIRTALSDALPPVVADADSVRQITLNLLANAVKLTGAGGQIIVSTAVTDDGEVALRVRDTGAGLSEKELADAFEPFRDLATTPKWGASGTGLGLPITKALAEANHAALRISSAVESGTLVEVLFPATRAVAE